MDRVLRPSRLAACLSVILVAMGCTAQPPSTTQDGIWTGNARNGDFNTPGNWSPPVVPTGIATINPTDYPVIRFSVASTKLAGINMTGMGRVILDEKKLLEVKERGLTLCCGAGGTVFVHGVLTGNIDFGESGPAQRILGGNGTLEGNVRQTNAFFDPGSGDVFPVKRTFTVRGSYLLSKTGTMTFTLDPGHEMPHLDVAGAMTLDGGVLLIYPDRTAKTVMTFTAIKAGQINGRFRDVQSYDPGFTVTAEYRPPTNPTEVFVTVTPK